jgi:glycerophosphoryl diester phosphodiesterase
MNSSTEKKENPNKGITVFWQAHRGGGAHEAPDNTMAANRYCWELGGIPEADIRATADGVIVCLHDKTPARTTNAPDEVKDRPVTSFTFEEIRRWDAGIKFDERFQGERIPSLEEVFAEMQGRPERLMYLDLKEIDLAELGRLIDRYEVNKQVLFAHNQQKNCISMKNIAAGVRTMLWIGGTPESIETKFAAALESGFEGLDQVQIHLNGFNADAEWSYDISREFIQFAYEQTSKAGVDLELFPFLFEERSIHTLLAMGITWYATDEPARFVASVQSFC